MKSSAFHVLRVGIAITFLWIGILIFRDPAGWGGYLQPWAAALIPVPLKTFMAGIAIFDVTVGILLLIDFLTFWAAVLATIHLFIVIFVAGITEITIRDLGLLTGTLALAISTWPPDFPFFNKFKILK